MNPVIQTSQLCCKIGAAYLLKNINWSVQSGEKWVVYGLNGCGKTTLLSIIAGYRNQTDGQLNIFGDPYSQENLIKKRKQIGWISTSFFEKYYTKESVQDIILSGKFGTLGLNYDITLKDICKVKKLVKELGIADKINSPFDTLSKGQRQKVLIARALFPNPKLLILDEPCSGLDAYHRSHLFSSIQNICDTEDVTVIYVTHYTEEIMDVFDHMLLLKNGEIYAQGKIEDVLNEQLLNSFFGYEVHLEKQQDGFHKLNITVNSNITAIIGGEDLC